MNNLIAHIVRFLVLLVVQIFICNHIYWFGFLNPQVYLMALLLLPIKMDKHLQYLVAFFTGLIIDIFLQTFGLFASASLVMIFIRPWLLYLMNGFRHYEEPVNPSPSEKSLSWLLAYIFPLVLLHQLWVNVVEIADVTQWLTIIWTGIANAIFTTFIILCFLYIFRRSGTRGE